MKTIAIITALQSEFDAILSLYDFTIDEKNVAKTNIYGKNILLIKSGIGKVNASLATIKAIQNEADLVITTGLAGGIDDSLRQGDIVLADKVCYHDVWCGEPNLKGQVQDFPLYFETPSALINKLNGSVPKNYWVNGLTVTGDVFLTDERKLKEIKQEFPLSLAVDMESAAIAQTCYLNNKPFISLRIISDVVGRPEQKEQYEKFWQNVPDKASEMVDSVLKNIS